MKTGIDVRISPLAVISRPELVEIGDHVAIDPFTVITTALKLGSYIHIAPHCTIIGGREGKLVMEDFSGLAAGCRIICSSDDYTGLGIINPLVPPEYQFIISSTIILKKFATLATNVIVFPGVTVGEGAVAGAGSIVDRDLEPWGIYAGTPVKKIGMRHQHRILAYAAEILNKTQPPGETT